MKTKAASPYGRGTGVSDPVDIQVGRRVRSRRDLLGITQTELAQALGLTFQQVQKYEKGNNRIGASRLAQIARFLDVPVGYFFAEGNLADGLDRATLRLVYAFAQLPPALADSYLGLVTAAAAAGGGR